MNKVLNSLNTITSQFLSLSKTKNKNSETKSVFDNLFYHLRPGTYDITVKRSIPEIKKKRKIRNLEPYFHSTILQTIFYLLMR